MEGDPVLIALHSVKGVGKDTTFRFIQEWCARKSDPAPSAVRRGFADKAKWAYARAFFPTINETDAIKWVDTFKDSGAEILGPGPVGSGIDVVVTPFRQHMAQFATEGGRDIYGLDHWVDQVLPLNPSEHNPEGWRGSFLVPPTSEADFPYSFATYAVMTDLRFPNELKRIRALNGLAVKIRRRDAEQAVIDEAKAQGRKLHESELGLPDELFDVVIDNSSNDMDDARRRTNYVMHEVEYNGVASIQRGLPLPWLV